MLVHAGWLAGPWVLGYARTLIPSRRYRAARSGRELRLGRSAGWVPRRRDPDLAL